MFHRINVRECFIAGGKASLVEAFDLKHKKKKTCLLFVQQRRERLHISTTVYFWLLFFMFAETLTNFFKMLVVKTFVIIWFSQGFSK